MKKIFTSISRRLLMAVVAVMASTSVFAGDSTFYPYKYNVEVLPKGAGLVYSNGGEEIDQNSFSDWQESVQVAKVEETLITFTYVNIYGKPNDGWLWSGVAYGQKDENGLYEIMKDENGTIKLAGTGNPSNVEVSFHTNSFSSEAAALTALEEMEKLDTMFYALFCRVRPDFASGHQKAGKVFTSNPVNDMGDVVELSAVPTVEGGEFLYWTKNDKENGEKITENPLKLTVNETATYYAHFSAPNAVQFKGDEGWLIWYRPTTMLLSEDDAVVGYRFQEKNFVDENNEAANERLSYFSKLEDTNYSLYGTVPHILHVTAPTLMVDNMLTPGATIVKSYTVGGWTGENGIDTDTIEAENYYYICDMETRSFKLYEDGFVLPAEKFYLAVPVSACMAEAEAPKAIYWSLEDAYKAVGYDAISEVEKDKLIANGKKISINGMEMISVGKGIYILNGKKYVK